MTVKELIKGVLRTDLYEMLVWAMWYFDPKRDFLCKECLETRKMGSGKAPNCDLCGLPTAKLLKKYFGKESV
jgi:hypothetical protein